MAVRHLYTAAESFYRARAYKKRLMASYDQHRRQLGVWSRLLIAVVALIMLFAPYLVGTRGDYPALFWSATAMSTFFTLWAGSHVVWHYWVLRR